jgi:hypothetical protein
MSTKEPTPIPEGIVKPAPPPAPPEVRLEAATKAIEAAAAAMETFAVAATNLAVAAGKLEHTVQTSQEEATKAMVAHLRRTRSNNAAAEARIAELEAQLQVRRDAETDAS